MEVQRLEEHPGAPKSSPEVRPNRSKLQVAFVATVERPVRNLRLKQVLCVFAGVFSSGLAFLALLEFDIGDVSVTRESEEHKDEVGRGGLIGTRDPSPLHIFGVYYFTAGHLLWTLYRLLLASMHSRSVSQDFVRVRVRAGQLPAVDTRAPMEA